MSKNKKYQIQLKFDDDNQSLSKTNGISMEEIAGLLVALEKAIDFSGKSYLVDISDNCYAAVIQSSNKNRHNKIIDIHKRIKEIKPTDLRNSESRYAYKLRRLLPDGRFLDILDGDKSLAVRLFRDDVQNEVNSYYSTKKVSGIISEIGSPNLKSKTHIILADLDYKIYTTKEQDKALNTFYRNGRITLRIKQKISLQSGSIISAELIDFTIPNKSDLIESLSLLDKDILDSIRYD